MSYHVINNIYSRLTKTVEDVYRRLAQQEFKRVRDKLASDNVRLGRIVVHRTVSLSLSLSLTHSLYHIMTLSDSLSLSVSYHRVRLSTPTPLKTVMCGKI